MDSVVRRWHTEAESSVIPLEELCSPQRFIEALREAQYGAPEAENECSRLYAQELHPDVKYGSAYVPWNVGHVIAGFLILSPSRTVIRDVEIELGGTVFARGARLYTNHPVPAYAGRALPFPENHTVRVRGVFLEPGERFYAILTCFRGGSRAHVSTSTGRWRLISPPDAPSFSDVYMRDGWVSNTPTAEEETYADVPEYLTQTGRV